MTRSWAAGLSVIVLSAAGPARGGEAPAPLVLRAARVFDGATLRTGWEVVVSGGTIAAALPRAQAPPRI
jgi:hypothetical protein